jgi:putative SOS response-associated peptidase YedK
MCNDYEQHVRWAEYRKMMQELELGIPSQQAELDLPQADDVRINDIGPVMRATGNGIELVPMTFSFPPSREGGAPVFNFRSEGRHFVKSNRCLVPASAFFEFTGKRYPKAKHRFSLKGSPITAIAGIWKPGQGNHPPSFTMLTTAPGPDVVPYHHRQVVVLRPEDWSAWINLTKTEGELLRPLPRGLLDVAKVVRASADPSALPSTEPRSTHVSQARPAPLNQPSGDASSTPLSGFGFDGKACGLWD